MNVAVARSVGCVMACAMGVSACATEVTPERAAERCEARARAAQAPEVDLTLGASSSGDRYIGGGISLSSDLLRNRDPLAVYESCVLNLTGEAPIRPPVLRRL